MGHGSLEQGFHHPHHAWDIFKSGPLFPVRISFFLSPHQKVSQGQLTIMQENPGGEVTHHRHHFGIFLYSRKGGWGYCMWRGKEGQIYSKQKSHFAKQTRLREKDLQLLENHLLLDSRPLESRQKSWERLGGLQCLFGGFWEKGSNQEISQHVSIHILSCWG